MITLDKIKQIVKKDQIAFDLFALQEKYGVDTPNRMAHFLSQVMHESLDFTHLSENLNYGWEGLLEYFSKYFTTVTAKQYARKPQAIANKVYANRMGNRNEASGDGWRYRGGGFIQITGKNNYKAVSDGLGVDFVSNPDLLRTEKYGLESALWWWKKNGLNELADTVLPTDIKDKDVQVKRVSKRVNGGYNGLDDRIKKYAKIIQILKTPN